MSRFLKSLWRDEAGQGLTEYVLIIALVAVGLIAVMGFFRDELGRVFDSAIDQLEAAPGNPYQSTNAPSTGG